MKFILASASPRRIEYLKKFGFDFEVKKAKVEEIVFENDPVKTVIHNAYLKAYSLGIAESIPVIGMDTVVAIDGKILGKPKTKEDNYKMITALLGKVHKVITGVVALKGELSIIDYVISLVRFRKDFDIGIVKAYIETGEGLDKAGGYAIQGLGSIFIEEVKGPVDNIIGIPILKVNEILKIIEEV
jgi:septum formation protein